MMFEGEDEVESTAQTTESVVLEEELPDDYEPTQDEILEYAKWLGMEPDRDQELFWIAREGLKAPLPENWKPCQTGEHEIYYFNFATGESVWDHPCDEYYRNLYHEEVEKKTKRDEEKSKKKEEKKKKDKVRVCMRAGAGAGGMCARCAVLRDARARTRARARRRRCVAVRADVPGDRTRTGSRRALAATRRSATAQPAAAAVRPAAAGWATSTCSRRTR